MTRRQQIMDILAAAPDGLRTTEIADRLGVKNGSMNSTVSRMYHYGYIDRERDKVGPYGFIWRLKAAK